MSKADASTVWERAEPGTRPVPVPLSRDGIVRAAIALADAEGLAAVTLRKVGGALGAGPMRLYGYVATKEELLELMVDAVYAEMLGAEAAEAAPWREQVTAIARATRDAARRHPWFADLLGSRPHHGPNALAYFEALLAALTRADGLDGVDAMLQAAQMVHAYVLGAIRLEASETLAERESGLTKEEWQGSTWPYLQRMLATGRFPNFARVVNEAKHPDPTALFDAGLARILAAL